MRRLSIIDLSTGHQPIHNEDRTVWIVFNGEIYNFRTLRAELEHAGHRFYTATDTEVIVHAYEQWGIDAISRLRGMFGLAIWDARSRIAARWRATASASNRFTMPSSVDVSISDRRSSRSCAHPTLLATSISTRSITTCRFSIPRAMVLSFRMSTSCLPAHCLVWHDGRVTTHCYWRLPTSESFSGSAEEAATELRHVLKDAVASHLVSDVPIGAFLSGGVDSSVVVGLMAEASAPASRLSRLASTSRRSTSWSMRGRSRTTSAPTTTSSSSSRMLSRFSTT